MKAARPQPFAPAGVNGSVTAVASLEHDAELMLRVRDGCNTSFALLLERHRTTVVHYMFRMVQNRAVAEELAQDVFLRVYRSRASYEPTAKFRTWLFRIATHLALNWLRDGKYERGHESLDVELGDGLPRQVADGRPTAEDRMLKDSRYEEVRHAIQTLPEKQRAAVLMHKYQEMDYASIAAVFECSESAVKSLLFRAYESLRARLAHLDGSGVERERRQ